MAANLQSYKKRIKTAENISTIARAMETIAASKIRKAQSAVENNRPYSEKITVLVDALLANLDKYNFEHPLLKKNSSPKKLVIVLSPDKGLCGSLTANLIKKLSEYEQSETYIIAIGKKVEKFLVRHGYDLIAAFPSGTKFPGYGTIYPIIDITRKYYFAGNVSEVDVVFTEFKSFFTQSVSAIRLIPVQIDKEAGHKETPFIFEPNYQTILSELLPYYVEVKLYNALINAFTSEQAARMIAMHNAKENAIDLTGYLVQAYNRLRQEKITNEILDISNM